MRVSNMPDTCTGMHFFEFGGDYYGDDQVADLRNQVKAQLDNAKRQRKVCVFAFLIASQTKAAAVLEDFGFVCTFNAHNYKYPDTSRFLKMYTKDMNDWEITAPVQTVNPFAQAQTLAAQPAPVHQPIRTVRALPREYPAHVPVPDVIDPWVNGVNGLTYRVRGVTHRSLNRIRAVHNGVGTWRNIDDGRQYNSHPFPRHQWVSIPHELTAIPPSLQNQNVFVLTSDGRVHFWGWAVWTLQGQIVAVMRA